VTDDDARSRPSGDPEPSSTPTGAAAQTGDSGRPDAASGEPGDGTPGGAEPGTTAGDAAPTDRARRRRRLIIAGAVTVAVLVVLAGCLAVGALVGTGARLADRADDGERRRDRLDVACLELEDRLNRLSPPGATGGDPRRRAGAIRNENAAVRPILVELELVTERNRDDGERRRPDARVDGWRQLVDARTAYAEALDRQATGGEPAFFLAPRAADGGEVVEALERRGPDSCSGAVRRLGRPDL
jgi:hypothetical protein